MDSSNIQSSTTYAVSRPSQESRAEEHDSASQPNDAGTTTSPNTGTEVFASYKDYLDSIVEHWPEYKDLYDCFFNRRIRFTGPTVLVLEETDCTLKSQIISAWDDTETHFKARLKACSEDVKTRVVVAFGWDIEVLDYIGLVYNVDPTFFLAAPIWEWDNTDEPQIPISDSPKIFQLSGKMAAQVLRHQNTAGQEHSVGKSNAFFLTSKGLTNSSAVLIVVYLPRSWRPIIEDRPLGPHSHTRNMPLHARSVNWDFHMLNLYQNITDGWNKDQIRAAKIEPLLYIQPFIKILAEDFSTKVLELRHLHRKFLSSRPTKEGIPLLESVAKATELLCSELHDFDSFIQKFRDFRASKAQVSSTQQEDPISYCEGVLEDGRRTTKLSREMLQTNFSLWSIRDSNRSIEEAESLKRLTQLAFIFVPLSFVTSFFGMNVQELSGDGVKLWIFLVTAVCMGCSTVLFWRILSPIQVWWKRHPPQKSGRKWYWLYQIVREGALLGAIKTGAIIGFLTSGRFGPRIEDSNYYYNLYLISW